jgi:hypothetical protein
MRCCVGPATTCDRCPPADRRDGVAEQAAVVLAAGDRSGVPGVAHAGIAPRLRGHRAVCTTLRSFQCCNSREVQVSLGAVSARVLVLLLVLARSAGAGAGVLVHWQAPPECPDDADVDARTARRLGPSVRAAAPIEVIVRSDDDGYVAEIGDARSLRSPSCDELADAVALIAARLVLDEPAAVAAAPLPPPAPPPVAVIARSAERGAAIGVAARLSGATGLGAQPGVGLGGELAVQLRRGAWFVEPAALLWARSTTSSAIGGVSAALREGTLRIGWAAPVWPVRVWVAADAGTIRGEGMHVLAPRAGTAMWAAAGAGAAAAWRLDGDIALVGGIELAAALLRPGFALADGDILYRPGAVAARLTLGVEVGWR